MTAPHCPCLDLTADQRAEYDGAYTFTKAWIRAEDDDSIDDELHAVTVRIETALTPLAEAAARGALAAINERLGTKPCACHRKDNA